LVVNFHDFVKNILKKEIFGLKSSLVFFKKKSQTS